MTTRIVCITGTVWSADGHAPRDRLVEAGFARPLWFTTGHEITDAQYKRITKAQYHLAASKDEVLLHVKYGGGFVGIMKQDFEDARSGSMLGVLIVGPPEVAEQVARLFPDAVLFAFKCVDMALSEELEEASHSSRFHRIEVNSWEANAWNHAYEQIMEAIGAA